TLYQFWIHTELIGHMGWFERVFNTPAQHRVHHATNPRYLDKNYAATLCIWDRMFGTFEEEKEQPVYGLVKPLGTFNPLYAQVKLFESLWHRTGEMRGMDKVRVWLKGPDWGHPPAPEVSRATQQKHTVRLSGREISWLAVNFFAAVVATTWLLWNQSLLPLSQKLAVAGFLLLTMASWGALLERRRWLLPVELVRVASAAAAALLLVRAG
ncbi:MAG TPA: sterol desaturase family protein, partial [Myxococcales bacterium]|nr:sterol desaturase family protein [Myxococcales bacterium]